MVNFSHRRFTTYVLMMSAVLLSQVFANTDFLDHVITEREELVFYLLSIPDVREDLQLNMDAAVFLSDLEKKGAEEFEESATVLKMAQNANLKKSDRIAEIARAWKLASSAKMIVIKERIGSDAWQRLEEIMLRIEGLRRLCDDRVLASRLGLTDSQKSQISSVCSNWQRRRLDVAKRLGRSHVSGIGGSETVADRIAEIGRLQKDLQRIEIEFNDAIKDTLEMDQKKQWSEMLGAEIEIDWRDYPPVLLY